jgi:preprotein translocase SecE subunit
MAKPQRTRRKRSGFQQPAAAERARQRRREIKPVGQPKSQTGARRERRGGFRGFVAESIGELKKVEWPNRAQVIQGTIVVIVACAIVGAYLYAADQALKPLVQQILTGQ